MNIVALLENLKIETHREFFAEFHNIVDSSADKEALLRKFTFCLGLLNDLPRSDLYKSGKHFEKLKGYTNLYAMRIPTQSCNLRILYSYLPNGKILLHAFDKKGGKKDTDYEGHIPIAVLRLKDKK